VKELRLDGISDMDAGNRFLPGFVERFNERFALRAAKPEDLHRQVKIAPSRLSDILCHREQRYVGAQLSFHYDRKQIILERSDISENLGGQYVELYDFADRPLEVRWKGLLLPYRVFSKDQRVSHTAIVENKRLGHALAVVKAQQDLRRTPKVMTNSEKAGYRKRARMVNAPPLVLSDALTTRPRIYVSRSLHSDSGSSRSRRSRKCRVGFCLARLRARLYETRASAVLPSRRCRSACAECARW
jgi:hypothetical protein